MLPWKAKGVDFERILFRPKVKKGVGIFCQKAQDHGVSSVLDKKLISLPGLPLRAGRRCASTST